MNEECISWERFGWILLNLKVEFAFLHRFSLPKYVSDHFRNGIYNIQSPSAAILVFADMSAPPTYCPCDRNISNDCHTTQGRSFSPVLQLLKGILVSIVIEAVFRLQILEWIWIKDLETRLIKSFRFNLKLAKRGY